MIKEILERLNVVKENLEEQYQNESQKSVADRAAEAAKKDNSLDVYTAEEVFQFLDDLRDSAVTNMFGAGPYVEQEFGMQRREARNYTKAWMSTF